MLYESEYEYMLKYLWQIIRYIIITTPSIHKINVLLLLFFFNKYALLKMVGTYRILNLNGFML